LLQSLKKHKDGINGENNTGREEDGNLKNQKEKYFQIKFRRVKVLVGTKTEHCGPG